MSVEVHLNSDASDPKNLKQLTKEVCNALCTIIFVL